MFKWINPDKKPIVAFCGVGGSGKTTILRALDEKLQATNLKNDYIIFPSVVRDFYRANGVASELDYTRMPQAERTQFQFALCEHYIANIKKAVEENPERTIICDRSFVDHFAYSFIDTAFEQEQFDTLKNTLLKFYDMARLIVAFPPASFPSKDKFRHTPYSRIVLLSLAIGLGLSFNGGRSNILRLEAVTVEDRVNAIMDCLTVLEGD